jgi:predicted permease
LPLPLEILGEPWQDEVMKREHAWRRYLRFWGPNPEADVDDEFRFHLETKIEDLCARGMTREDAQREAARQFGPLAAPRASCVAVSRASGKRRSRGDYLGGWIFDVRYAIRVLRKAKASTAAAILILAVGIGVTVAVFTVLDRMIYEPLPVWAPSQLALVSNQFRVANGKRLSGNTFRYSDYLHLRDHNAVFLGLAAEATLVAHEQRPHEKIESPAEAAVVTGNFFDVLGVRPFAGRALTPSDDVRSAASHVAVAGYRFASRRYQQPGDAVGKTVYLNSMPVIIVGVMEPGFFGLQRGYDSDLYIPTGISPELFSGAQFDEGAYLRPIGRLLPHVDLARAQSNLQILYRQAVDANPEGVPDDPQVVCQTGAHGYSGVWDDQRRSLNVLSALVLTMLLIACANVACLLAARGTSRQHETAIRLSLGAARTRILRQSFVESCVLAVAGGAGALVVAQWGCRLLAAAFHWQKRVVEFSPDMRVLGFALAVSLLTALLFGLAPALQLLRGGRVPLTHDYSVAPFSSGKVLVSVEVALSLVLLTGAAVFVRSFQNIRSSPTGFVAQNVSVIRLLPYYDDETKPPLHEVVSLIDDLRGSTLIQSATAANFGVFNAGYVMSIVRPVDNPLVRPARLLMVAQDYWKTLGIPLISGRGFTGRDDKNAPRVAVLNESLAAKLFPNQNPLGKYLFTGPATREPKPGDETEVVGIVKDTRLTNLAAPPPDLVYFPIFQGFTYNRGLVLEVRSSLQPAAVGALVTARVKNLHLPLSVMPATALNDEIGASLENDYIRMRASSLFATLGLVLIASGLYGLMAYTVARRTREIGIRAAVGAGTFRIMALVLRQSLRLVAVGIAIGIPGALAVMRALKGLVFGLPPVDVPSLAIAAALLVLAGAAASFIPAWRAAHLDPMQALRVQ